MLKTQSLNCSFPVVAEKFPDHLFHVIYDFCFCHRYTFIAYAHPQEAQKPPANKKKTRIGKKSWKRSIRILISGGGGQGKSSQTQTLKYKSLLDIRDLTPGHPGFIFSPFDGSRGPSASSRFSFFEVQVIIAMDEWSYDKKNYRGKIRYREGMQAEEILARLQDYLKKANPSEKGLSKLWGRINYRDLDMGQSGKKYFKNNAVTTKKKDFCDQIKDQVARLKLHAENGSHFKSKTLKEKALKKIVISKLRIISPPTKFDPVDVFFQMIDDFPFSFVNWVSGPEVGTWMGASPEILVRRDARKIFHTVSLAGTQWIDDSSTVLPPLHRVAWTQKEIEEQAVTSRFIIDCFKKIRLREYVEEGPVTVRKGNLLHLQSSFSVDLKRYYGDSLPYEMLALLHPTPAVAGVPQSSALDEIRRIEKHDRGYYAGFLGPVEIDDTIDVYVNLRCMEWLKVGGKICCGLYSGVGVNRFSEPEKEWEESEAKIKWWVDTLQKNF